MTYTEASDKVDALVAMIKANSNYKSLECQNAYTVGFLSSILTALCYKSAEAQKEVEFFLKSEKEPV